MNGNKISGKNKLVFKTPVTFDPETQSISAKKPPRVKNKGAGKNKKNKRNGGRDLNDALTKDERTVLVVRVVTNNGETPQTVDDLKEHIFDMNTVSMSSQFAKCSHDQVSFIPTTNRNGTGGVNIVDGIVTVTIDANVEDGDVFVKQKIDDKIFDHFKTNRNNLADHVMYIYPDGVMAGIAYANVNGVLSVYSGDWGSSLTATLHEIGHNLNLHHSGKAGNQYADESGAVSKFLVHQHISKQKQSCLIYVILIKRRWVTLTNVLDLLRCVSMLPSHGNLVGTKRDILLLIFQIRYTKDTWKVFYQIQTLQMLHLC